MYRHVRNLLLLLPRAYALPTLMAAMTSQVSRPVPEHMTLTADGLLRASQRAETGGYAGFDLLHGRQPACAGTTAALVSTALDLAIQLDRPDLRLDALKQGVWLLSQQAADGGFRGEGQALSGLERLHQETGDERYAEAAARAADWLCGRVADAPGAAALIAHGKRVGDDRHVGAGRRILDGMVEGQLASGLFPQTEPVFGLGVMVAALEALLDAHALTGEPRYRDAVDQGAAALLDASLNREVILFARYDAGLVPLTHEKCLTGLGRWARLTLRLFEMTGDERYREAASNALYYLKTKQLPAGGGLSGALPACVPIWAGEPPFSYPGAALGAFGDALLAWTRLGLDAAREQEVFAGTSHCVNSGKVGWTVSSTKLSPVDLKALERLEKVMSAAVRGGQPVVVDLGCGEGRYMDWLEARHPDWRYIGVDPQPPSFSHRQLEQGSAGHIPMADHSADFLYAAVALQHVGDIEGALVEVRRVLKPGGLFMVFDRNLISLRGLMKPWHEIRGRWLYSWDAPFRERWYTPGRWRAMLRQAGYTVTHSSTLSAPTGRGWRRLLPISRFVFIAGRTAGPTEAKQAGLAA